MSAGRMLASRHDALGAPADVPDEESIRVWIRFGQSLHSIAGQARVSMSLPPGSTVADVTDLAAHRFPDLCGALRTALPIVDGAQADQGRKLSDGRGGPDSRPRRQAADQK